MKEWLRPNRIATVNGYFVFYLHKNYTAERNIAASYYGYFRLLFSEYNNKLQWNGFKILMNISVSCKAPLKCVLFFRFVLFYFVLFQIESFKQSRNWNERARCIPYEPFI